MPLVEAVRKGNLNRPSSLEGCLREDFHGQAHRIKRTEVRLKDVEGAPGVRSGWYDFDNKVLGWALTELDPGSSGLVHRQLCESTMWILEGQGYTIVNGDRVDWKAGDILFVPLFAWHQHVNTGSAVARYARMSTAPLYYYLGVYRQENLTPPSWERAKQETGPHRSVILRREDWLEGGDWDRSAESENLALDFDYRVPTSPRIPSLLPVGEIGGMHRHASEAQIYIFQGKGSGSLNEVSVPLEAGDVIRVPLFSWHQLRNTGDVPFIYLKNNSAGIYNRLSILMRDIKKGFGDGDISALKDDFKVY